MSCRGLKHTIPTLVIVLRLSRAHTTPPQVLQLTSQCRPRSSKGLQADETSRQALELQGTLQCLPITTPSIQSKRSTSPSCKQMVANSQACSSNSSFLRHLPKALIMPYITLKLPCLLQNGNPCINPATSRLSKTAGLLMKGACPMVRQFTAPYLEPLKAQPSRPRDMSHVSVKVVASSALRAPGSWICQFCVEDYYQLQSFAALQFSCTHAVFEHQKSLLADRLPVLTKNMLRTGYVPPGDKYAGLPTISILVSSDLVSHRSQSKHIRSLFLNCVCNC